jgi:hypothetical protein
MIREDGVHAAHTTNSRLTALAIERVSQFFQPEQRSCINKIFKDVFCHHPSLEIIAKKVWYLDTSREVPDVYYKSLVCLSNV